jgi:pimeloyl-ACP methyl ester carboxylesterase
MAGNRPSKTVHGRDVTLEVYVEGTGSALVVLPSYGRGGDEDFDSFASKVSVAGFTVVHPLSPARRRRWRGCLSMTKRTTLRQSFSKLGHGKLFVLGHAFGHGVAKTVAVDHPALVYGIILAAAQGSSVPSEINQTPYQACDLSAPVEERLAALRKGFFAPNHDASIWLDGWYPETMRMQVSCVGRTPVKEFWGAGSARLLEIIPDSDPFKPREYWGELREQLGNRVTTEVVKDASHALFPEQPDGVAGVVIEWCRRLLSGGRQQEGVAGSKEWRRDSFGCWLRTSFSRNF